MTKNIIAQTRPAVQLRASRREAHPANRIRQLRQLSRLAPALYERITGNMKSWPELDYSRHIAEAMKRALSEQSNGHASDAPGDVEARSILVNVAGPDGNCATEVVQLPDRPLYDLVIASRKYGFSSTTNANAPIEWWKVAGGEQQSPPGQVSLTDPIIQQHLAAYELVDTEIHPMRIIRKYRKLQTEPQLCQI